MKNEHHRKWQAYREALEQGRKAYVESDRDPSMIPYLLLPAELRDMRCEAKTRAGTPCKMRALYRKGRCKLHGGLSTGPKTEAGKKRSALNGMKKKKQEGPP